MVGGMPKTKIECRTRLERQRTFRGTNDQFCRSRFVKSRSMNSIATSVFVFGLVFAEVASAQDSAHKTGEAWQIIPLAQSSLVYARDGSPIGEIGHEMRTSVSIRTLPKY